MKAVVIGAGRIGCGLVAERLRASGHDVVLGVRDAALADHLARTGRYVVRLAGPGRVREVTVAGVGAVLVTDTRRVERELATAGLVATAVGATNLAAVAPLVAAGLARRRRPVNVLAFENDPDPGARLRALVAAELGERAVARHGFAGALVARVVARRLGDVAGDGPLVFVGDEPASFVVDGRRLVAPLPAIEGMLVSDRWTAWVCRKLYLYGAGHATTAYLGHLKGYHYVHSAIRDPEIRAAVLAAMAEAQAGLARRFGAELAGGPEELARVVERFENAALGDPNIRVGRDPLRKLAEGERLVGAARAAEQAGVSPASLALAVAAALCFRDPRDVSAGVLEREIRSAGLRRVLTRVCGLDPRRGFGRAVTESLERLRDMPHSGGAPLLRLDELLWA